VRALGLDLGGTNVKWAVVEDERLVAQGRAPTHAEQGPAAVVARLAEIGRSALAETGSVDRAGVGLPGLFDPGAGTVTFLPNLAGDWSGVAAVAPLEDALGVPVSLVNDARAFALAEWRLGAARGCDDAAFFVIGTGVGGGLVLGGRLHLGHDGTAGELGHQIVEADGPPCGCGDHGCVESLAAGPAIVAASGRGNVREAAEAARDGDERARAAFDRAGRALGVAAANVVVMVAPERVVVGGGVAESGELLLGPMRAELDRRVRLKQARTPVVSAELGPIAGAVGAAVRAAS
jgi:glucokinase